MDIQLPKIGDRVRFAIWHANAWRPLGWLRVGKDCSIYFGLLSGTPSVAKETVLPSAKQVQFRYQEFKEVPPPKSSRVSFKVSGEIHLGDSVRHGAPFSDLNEGRQLCTMIFAHPSRYRPPKKTNRYDFDVNIVGYAPVDDRPMWGGLFVAPFTDSPRLGEKPPSMETAVSFAVGYRGLTCAPDLVVQIVFGHGATGPWPALPCVVVL